MSVFFTYANGGLFMVMPTVVLVSTFAMRLATAVFVTRTVGRLELQCRVADALLSQ